MGIVQYEQIEPITVRAHFTGTDTVPLGGSLSYDHDNADIGLISFNVEQPSASNLPQYAGVTDAGFTGPKVINVICAEFWQRRPVKVYKAGANTTSEQLLKPVAGSYAMTPILNAGEKPLAFARAIGNGTASGDHDDCWFGNIRADAF